MSKNNQVLIIGGSSEIGLSIIKLYHSKKYKILAHYNKGNKIFLTLLKKIK